MIDTTQSNYTFLNIELVCLNGNFRAHFAIKEHVNVAQDMLVGLILHPARLQELLDSALQPQHRSTKKSSAGVRHHLRSTGWGKAAD